MNWLSRIFRRDREVELSRQHAIFGKVKYRNGKWRGSLPFKFAPTHTDTIEFCIEATADDGPTEVQQLLLQDILTKYQDIWPSIAEALLEYQRATHESAESFRNIGDLVEHINGESLWISIPKNTAEGSLPWSIQFDFEDVREDVGYFVHVKNWKVVRVVGVD